MPERIINLIGHLPFMLVIKGPGKNHVALNWARVIEALLIAVVTGYFTGYVSVAKLEVKFDLLSEQLRTTQQQLFIHMNRKE